MPWRRDIPQEKPQGWITQSNERGLANRRIEQVTFLLVVRTQGEKWALHRLNPVVAFVQE